MSKPIRAVDRALEILLCFSQDESELTLTAISERVGLYKSTVLRLLATLQTKGFIQRDAASGKYRLGLRIVELAAFVLEQMDLRRQAWPFMRRLSEQHLETVDLGVLDGTDIVYLEVIESPQRVKLAAATGQRLPACCTSSGKAILAYLPENQVRQIMVRGLRRFTLNTIVSPDDLQAQLKGIRERGFATAESEYEDGINAVAAPILDSRQRPFAVIALAGPSFRLPLKRMLEIGPSVRQCADDIAREIGLAASLVPGFNRAERLQRARQTQQEEDGAPGT